MRISTSFLILQMVLLYVIIGNVSAQNINGKYYHDSLLLYSPSYEHYSFLANYKLNQLINEVLDVTSIGSISGTILGLLSGLPSYIKRKDEIKSGLYLMIPSLTGVFYYFFSQSIT